MNTVAQSFAAMSGIGRGVYQPADFTAVRDMVYRTAGIVLIPAKAMLVYSRLAPLVREAQCGTFAAYVERLGHDQAERHRAVCALTTNHTHFFRAEHQFAHLSSQLRPDLLRRADRGEPVRLWSAGCSSGEETWSIAFTLLGGDVGQGRRIAAQDVRILATDLDDHVLGIATTAIYRCETLGAIPSSLRVAWLTETNERATVADAARAIVRYRALNLLDDWPLRRPFDVIFCRNVMIYFDQPTKNRLVERLAHQLVPGGHLYVGLSERVCGPASEMLTLVGPAIYQRRAA